MDGTLPADSSLPIGAGNCKANEPIQLIPTSCSTALSPEHMGLEDLVSRLRDAIKSFFPNDSYRYKEVHTLLLSWEDDDLGVVDEVLELKSVFRDDYDFDTVRLWVIPRHRPYSKLEDELYQFRKEFSSTDNLLIVYYAGHGYLDYSRSWKWAAYR